MKMGRREIIASLLICGIGAGLAAVSTALLAPSTPFTTSVIFAGAIICVLCFVGVYILFRFAPKPSLPLSAIDIGFAVASAIKGEVIEVEHREFIPTEITPCVLRRKVSGRTSVQIDALNVTYAGKHMRIKGLIRDVSNIGTSSFLIILDTYSGEGGDQATLVSLIFDEPWKDRMMALNLGDEVTVVGKLTTLRQLSFQGIEVEHIGRPEAKILPPLTIELPDKPKPKPRRRARTKVPNTAMPEEPLSRKSD